MSPLKLPPSAPFKRLSLYYTSTTGVMETMVLNMAKHIQLTAAEEAIVLSKVTQQHIKAKTLLAQPGTIASEIYFVNSGILRSFTINDHIVEHILHFACEGWWMADMASFTSQQPGNLFIEVLEDAHVTVLTKTALTELYDTVPKLERFFRILAENSLVTHQERLMDSLKLTAEERIEKFCTQYPSLVQQVPQKQIAAFIGVTPEFFSKAKSRLMRK
jgi:CRP-like cAMP-binding protein